MAHPERPLTPTCTAAVDNSDGTYTGFIDGRAAGDCRFATVRVFRRVAGAAFPRPRWRR